MPLFLKLHIETLDRGLFQVPLLVLVVGWLGGQVNLKYTFLYPDRMLSPFILLIPQAPDHSPPLSRENCLEPFDQDWLHSKITHNYTMSHQILYLCTFLWEKMEQEESALS